MPDLQEMLDIHQEALDELEAEMEGMDKNCPAYKVSQLLRVSLLETCEDLAKGIQAGDLIIAAERSALIPKCLTV